LKDPETWAFAMIQAGITTDVGTVGVFLPSFVKAFGYSPRKTLLPNTHFPSSSYLLVQRQLFSVILYACAFVTPLSVCIVSDRINKKGIFLFASLSVACLGYIILLTSVSVHVKAFATCLVISDSTPQLS
jgi:hypothetical protein